MSVCNTQNEVLNALCDKRQFTLSTTLTELALYDKIGPSGAKLLSDALEVNTTLTALALYHDKIGCTTYTRKIG